MFTNSIGMQLKLVQPGTFPMGKSRPYHEPDHEVTLTEPFRLGIYPVTQAEYERVMKTNPSRLTDDERRPVILVSWFDAVEFCNRLSEQERLPPYYDVEGQKVTVVNGVGYRLPTEAEWEYACRAGSEQLYCFGDDESQLHQYAWYNKNADGTTHPVGEKQPNAWGLYDMHGNVTEWCWDCYSKLPSSPAENPVGPSQGSNRMSRGGCHYDTAGRCTAAYRLELVPEIRDRGVGFRVATAIQ